MTIVVVFDGLRFDISPNPAIVQVGDRVEWTLWYAGTRRTGEIKWRVRFGNSPFSQSEYETVVSPDDTSVSSSQPGSYGGYPEGKIKPGDVTESGLYKYDLEVRDRSDDKLGEEDPYLLVQWAVAGGIP